ncbi:hypothetical protein DFA_08808 [Cavenderia fasciculata]|uniref:Uncharacterized protein n=1 Tax=Cavenderia fasciculata TaxID=261658 RepID=F4Q4F9_CACFS|nr:uncharacterized protein DFA_08808 [Cavenderia fasciculata]EGG17808.1 hypothetical protein DFA_08808 [Cavenderia fasciculata]|eukprot:XP_004356292.1 hypothetical protein DFA_08808 [Cavenderia fasciculata]
MTLIDEEKFHLQEYTEKKKRNLEVDLPLLASSSSSSTSSSSTTTTTSTFSKSPIPPTTTTTNGLVSAIEELKSFTSTTATTTTTASTSVVVPNNSIHNTQASTIPYHPTGNEGCSNRIHNIKNSPHYHNHNSIESLPTSAIYNYLQGLRNSSSSLSGEQHAQQAQQIQMQLMQQQQQQQPQTTTKDCSSCSSSSSSSSSHRKDYSTIDITSSGVEYSIDDHDDSDQDDDGEPSSSSSRPHSHHNQYSNTPGAMSSYHHHHQQQQQQQQMASSLANLSHAIVNQMDKPTCPNCHVIATRRHDKRRWWCKNCVKSFTPFRKGKKYNDPNSSNPSLAPQCGRCSTQATRKHDKRRWWCKSCKKPFTPNQFSENSQVIYVVGPNGSRNGGDCCGSDCEQYDCCSDEKVPGRLDTLLNHPQSPIIHNGLGSSNGMDLPPPSQQPSQPLINLSSEIFEKKRKYSNDDNSNNNEGFKKFNNSLSSSSSSSSTSTNSPPTSSSSSASTSSNIIMLAQQSSSPTSASSSLSSSPLPQSPTTPPIISVHTPFPSSTLQALATSCTISSRSPLTPPILKLTNNYDILDSNSNINNNNNNNNPSSSSSSDYLKDVVGSTTLKPMLPSVEIISNNNGNQQILPDIKQIHSEIILDNAMKTLVSINGEDQLQCVVNGDTSKK